jgi:hypothetical protein
MNGVKERVVLGAGLPDELVPIVLGIGARS